MISAIAGRLRRIGLHSDAIVGLQLANTRRMRADLAGGVARRNDRDAAAAAVAAGRHHLALGRAGASALIVSGRVGGHDQFDDALQAAAETFHIRFVCGFGKDVPDGVGPLSDLFSAETLDPLPPAEEQP